MTVDMDSPTNTQSQKAVDATQELNSESLPDVVTNGMLLQCERLGDQQLSQVWRYNATTVIKRVDPPSAARAEAAAMTMAHKKVPSVPVPRVLKTIIPQSDGEGAGYGIIFMQYIEGTTLEEFWPTSSDEDKARILGQLREYMNQLRGIEGTFIGSVDGSVCNDQLFANREHSYGPYKDEVDFRAGIAESLRSCEANAFTEVVVGMVNAMPKSGRSVFTHGDLVPRNILVRDGNVVGFVDWEMAGFYPEYWEYAKAHFFVDYDHPWHEERAVEEVLKPYPLELAALLHTRGIFMY
ncbi:hypothetical protein VM1G_10251 [Cytospora mali]|uniref:Aminoglycoside phosphotransferase domain-containing protein n=1 Tax=Cytospora mali TaxID=578113 RepID=A0A194VHQ5_CYTMA|nr:hypothetical protein VM1G_10251 [Valsa mali]